MFSKEVYKDIDAQKTRLSRSLKMLYLRFLFIIRLQYTLIKYIWSIRRF